MRFRYVANLIAPMFTQRIVITQRYPGEVSKNVGKVRYVGEFGRSRDGRGAAVRPITGRRGWGLRLLIG